MPSVTRKGVHFASVLNPLAARRALSADPRFGPRSQRDVMRYLLDTNVVSDLIRNPQGRIAQHKSALIPAQMRLRVIEQREKSAIPACVSLEEGHSSAVSGLMTDLSD